MTGWRTTRTPSDRLLGWLIALCGLLMISTRIPRILEQLPDFAAWWTALAALPLAAIVVLAFAGRWLRYSALRSLWTFAYVSLALALALVFAGYRGNDTETLLPWAWSLEAAVICFPILLLRPRLAVAVGLLLPILPLVSGLAFLRAVPAETLSQTTIHLGNIAFLVIFLGIRVRLSRLTAAEAEARRRLADQAHAEGVAQNRRELARTIHDEVLSVLTATTMLPGPVAPVLREEAGRAIAVLESRDVPTTAGEWTCSRFVAHLKAESEAIVSDIEFTAATSHGHLPAKTAVALISATREAIRNSREHAGAGAAIAVRVQATSAGIIVVITDDGAGFDLASIPAARLGVTGSILARINELPGGTATIRTGRAGRGSPPGTEVELRWRAR